MSSMHLIMRVYKIILNYCEKECRPTYGIMSTVVSRGAGGWTRSRELNRLRAPPMRLYGELVSLLLKPEYSRLRQGSVALIVINRNIIRTRLNP